VQLDGRHGLEVAHLAPRPGEDGQKPVGPGFDLVAQERLKVASWREHRSSSDIDKAWAMATATLSGS